jgi:hypothetical protein
MQTHTLVSIIWEFASSWRNYVMSFGYFAPVRRLTFGRETEAPLPAERVTSLTPFTLTGIDFAGPLYIKVGNDTRICYITLSPVRQHEPYTWNFAWTLREINSS